MIRTRTRIMHQRPAHLLNKEGRLERHISVKNIIIFALLGAALMVPTAAKAGPVTPTFTFDENGNAYLGTTKVAYSIDTITVLNPAGNGNMTVNALTYHLGAALQSGGYVANSVFPSTGDWRINDGGPFGPISDLLRWNNSGLLYVFSQPEKTNNRLADVGVPFTGHALLLFESPFPDGSIGVMHTSVQSAANGYPDGEPGYIPGGINYTFISDGTASTPEPSTLVLAGLGALGLAGYTWQRGRRRRQSYQREVLHHG
jgi:hypothetical protein